MTVTVGGNSDSRRLTTNPLSLPLRKGEDYYDNIIPLLTKEGLGEVLYTTKSP